MALPADARIGSATLTVSNLDRSLQFYEQTIGFQVLRRDGDVAALSADGETTLIELHERRGALPRPPRSAGLFHVAILVPSRAALGRSLRRLASERWRLTGVADHLVSEALYLDDPDGLGLEIYRDRPRESWRIEHGQVAMATDPLDVESVAREPGAEQPWKGLEPGTRIGHVHLQVSHLGDGEAFFCDQVGFESTLRGYPGALFVSAGGYHHHLGLNTWAGVGVPPPPSDAVGITRFTVVASVSAPRELTDRATGVTVSVEPPTRG